MNEEEYQPLTPGILDQLLKNMSAKQRETFFGPNVIFGRNATFLGRPISSGSVSFREFEEFFDRSSFSVGVDPGAPGGDFTVREVTVVNRPGKVIEGTMRIIEDEEPGTELAVR